jgi:predicted nucleotidyltransferase
MSTPRLQQVLERVAQDLSSRGAAFALVGGLAVSARCEPRFTRDVDLAVAVAGDPEAESLVRELRVQGYGILAIVEHEAAGRLATVRLSPPGEGASGVILDLLFASSGIEPEIVRAAEPVEVFSGLVVNVATVGDLIATKVLSRDDRRRPQDLVDLAVLLESARSEDLAAARVGLRQIEERGFHRGKDLGADLNALLASP